jgi:hypothetical protein
LHLEKGTCPALHRLEIFENGPTKQNLSEFLLLAKQDWGGRCAEAFTLWSDAVFTDEITATTPPVTRAFEVNIKDCFYDCFKAVSIAMTPKQIELLERHAFKLAAVFKAEISKAIGEQLETLVKRLKEKETKDNV